ncbi:hypothetical protein, partial [Mycobacteroides abscessus]
VGNQILLTTRRLLETLMAAPFGVRNRGPATSGRHRPASLLAEWGGTALVAAGEPAAVFVSLF